MLNSYRSKFQDLIFAGVLSAEVIMHMLISNSLLSRHQSTAPDVTLTSGTMCQLEAVIGSQRTYVSTPRFRRETSSHILIDSFHVESIPTTLIADLSTHLTSLFRTRRYRLISTPNNVTYLKCHLYLAVHCLAFVTQANVTFSQDSHRKGPFIAT